MSSSPAPQWLLALVPAAFQGQAPAPTSPSSADSSTPPAASSHHLTLTAGYDDHFFLQDETGRNRIELGALLQVNGSFFERGVDRESDFFLRRFRLEIGGQVEGFWKFNLEPKFTKDEFEFEEAWFGFDLDPDVRVMIGRMKEPFSLEEVITLKHLATINLSILNQFVPAEGHGLTIYGQEHERRFDWGAAVYRGGSDGLNGGTEGAARLVLRPWAAREDCLARGFQFGGSATIGRGHETLDGDELDMEAREPFATFEPSTELDGDRTRFGSQVAWIVGPVQLLAEAIRTSYDLMGTGRTQRATVDGWYVGGAWVLTGEDRTFQGVRPERPFLPGTTLGPGAIEFVTRYSRIRLSDDFVQTGALLATNDPGRVDSFDVGLNWYATWRARVKLHGLFTCYDDPILVGTKTIRREQALLLQFQLHF